MYDSILLLLILVVVFFVVQTIKVIATKKLDLKNYLTGTGGIVSSHSSCISAIPTFLFLTTGISVLFIICVAFAIVILRDAVGVRYAVGENAKILKKIYPKEKIILSEGHKISEVIFGVLLGIFLTTIIYVLI